MAQCFCRWRNVLICLCTPCILIALLMTYVTIMIFMEQLSTNQQSPLFDASGPLRNKSFIAIPKTFWGAYPDGDAIWNRLQLPIDRHFNPILNPRNTRKGFKHPGSLLVQSLSEGNASDVVRRHFEGLPQSLQNFVRSMHRRDYAAVLQPDDLCGTGENNVQDTVLLLLAIKTKGMNFQNRQAIRQTWGQVGWIVGHKRSGDREERRGGYVRRVFLLGKEERQSLIDEDLLRMESSYYGDILQWDFQETFFNLTLKDVLFWRWFSHTCNQTLFVFKGDDDVFVNTNKMVMYLHDQLRKTQADGLMKEFMVGDVIGAATPHRINDSKYFIPASFYKGLYPRYAGGGGVVYSALLAQDLYSVSKNVHLFPIDDVYVGMCMIRLNAYPIHHPAFLTFDFPEKEEQQPCAYHTVLLVHKRSPEQMIRLWANMKRTLIKCINVPLRNKK